MLINENYLYIIEGTGSVTCYLNIFNIVNPANPIFENKFPIDNSYDFDIFNNNCYIAVHKAGQENNCEIVVLDISNPTSPFVLTKKRGISSWSNEGFFIEVENNLIYTTRGTPDNFFEIYKMD